MFIRIQKVLYLWPHFAGEWTKANEGFANTPIYLPNVVVSCVKPELWKNPPIFRKRQ